MTLKAQIMDDIKRAMKAKDKATVGTIRMLTAAIKQVEVDERRELADADVLDIVGKMIKQRKDAANQFEQAGRTDLLDQELAEIAILTHYLPQQLTAEEITAIVAETIAATNASGMQDMGQVMGQVKAKVGLKADMGQVSQIVKAALS
ncbi:GatB/YqeY domain-containing protein [Marinicella meishanensis]|uniref:GatB/YqeY domain-containing protein n=1 Tax=Marinicella meishanensis TaxID=2873263 RepID=UPI001CBF47C1|nr:GatB/YqeY domain-containing protein [Marinicella sp. NBU2979]